VAKPMQLYRAHKRGKAKQRAMYRAVGSGTKRRRKIGDMQPSSSRPHRTR